VTEHVQHGFILAKRIGEERRDASSPRGAGQLIEQERPDPVVLVVIGYDEGDFGFCGTNVSVEPTHGNQLSFCLDYESQAVYVVDGGEPLDFASRKGRMNRKEPQIGRSLRKMLMELDQGHCIIGSDRTKAAASAVREDNRDLKITWIFREGGCSR
jgi:hypothetical protein